MADDVAATGQENVALTGQDAIDFAFRGRACCCISRSTPTANVEKPLPISRYPKTRLVETFPMLPLGPSYPWAFAVGMLRKNDPRSGLDLEQTSRQELRVVPQLLHATGEGARPSPLVLEAGEVGCNHSDVIIN